MKYVHYQKNYEQMVSNKSLKYRILIEHLLNTYCMSNFTRSAINIEANEAWFLAFIELKVGIQIYQEWPLVNTKKKL